jgi:biopolymer transport protein TolR
MGMSSGSGDKKSVQSEINVTPLIDVLLVLLIIFLVVMPIMMKMETLEIPRKITENEAPDPNATMLTVKVKATLDIVLSENEKETPILAADLMRLLRPKLEAAAARGAERVIFVDFEDAVPWGSVVTTMDSIRSLAADVNHDEVKVALKVKEDNKP